MGLIDSLTGWLRNDPAKKQISHLLPDSQYQSSDTSLDQTHFTVFDLETTGLNIHKDQILAMGAVKIEHNRVHLDQQFELLVNSQQRALSEATLVHGLSPGEIATGHNPVEALTQFFQFCGDTVLVGYHVEFDRAVLGRACKNLLNYKVPFLFLDVADLARIFLKDRLPSGQRTPKGLDDWATLLQLDSGIERHHASADALLTAELFLICLNQAKAQQVTTLTELKQKITLSGKLLQSQSHI
ncbi:exonuclease [Oleiphilus messinensis]|uniref:DNA-directed DNA polymerase n=1 Tax=Oleiphilus messinensis TaxID=141451 RepID=A0A1Y0IEG3_9GAMM|nr:3'-5' exonuclease [Oleiphilus messinensis]ARU57764.1 exonuclease [Oleiphilus messinensis]